MGATAFVVNLFSSSCDHKSRWKIKLLLIGSSQGVGLPITVTTKDQILFDDGRGFTGNFLDADPSVFRNKNWTLQFGGGLRLGPAGVFFGRLSIAGNIVETRKGSSWLNFQATAAESAHGQIFFLERPRIIDGKEQILDSDRGF